VLQEMLLDRWEKRSAEAAAEEVRLQSLSALLRTFSPHHRRKEQRSGP
jgi:hypothetical protein